MTNSHRLKICVLSTSFPVNEQSISGIFVKHLADALSRNSEVEVIIPVHSEGVPTTSESYAINTFSYAPKIWQNLSHNPGGVPVALKKNKLNYFILPFFLGSMLWKTLLAARRCDAIQANWAINGLIAGLAGKITNTPVITTLRGEDKQRATQSKIDKFILRNCVKWSSQIIAVSSEMHRSLMETFPQHREKIHFVPNGVGDEFLAISPKKIDGEDRELELVIIGSLIHRKGVSQLIRALSIIERRHPPILKIAGDGPLKDELIELSQQLGLANRVEFLGSIPFHTIAQQLAKSDALVLCSYSEGRPNVVIEAMAASLPVIATAIDGVTEIIDTGINGLLYNPDDIETLKHHIEYLIDHPERRQSLGHAARNTIIQNKLSWQSTAEKYLNLIEQSVNS